MADRAITDLTRATSMTDADLFAISQGGQAKSVTWHTFYSYLATALDGHGGINNITYTEPESGSLNGTLTIIYADDSTPPVTLTITNGRGISSITKTSTSGLTDTYTVTYNDNTTFTFTLDNGKGIASIADKWAVSDSNSTEPSTWYDAVQTMTTVNRYLWHYEVITFNDSTTLDTDKSVVGVYGDTGQDWHVWIKYSATEPTQDSDMSDNPGAWIGVYSGTASTAPTAYTDYTWYQHKGDKGDTGNSIDYISLYSTSGLVDTYRVYFTDGSNTTFTLTNGSQIDSITKTSTSGLVDTYTIALTDGTTETFTVTNGNGIASIAWSSTTAPSGQPHAPGYDDTYTITYTNGDSTFFTVHNGQDVPGAVSTVDGISPTTGNVSLLTLGNGAPDTSTVGALKSRYFDVMNSMLYVCTSINTATTPPTYYWQGASVTVDTALSTTSTNPVQNAVLTALLGTATLQTTAQTVTEAINELNTVVSGKVSKSGGTMTGNLDIEKTTEAELHLNSTTIERGVTPSGNANATSGRLVFRDKNGERLGNVSHLYTGARSSQTSIRAYNTIENTQTEEQNALILSISRAGVRSVSVSEASPWRAALELGTSGAFPLTIAQGGTGGTTRAEALANLGIQSFQISANQSQTINFSGNGCIVYGARGNTSFIAAVDYWSDSVNILAIGAGGAGVSITKTANVHSITITNTRSSLAIVGGVISAITS